MQGRRSTFATPTAATSGRSATSKPSPKVAQPGGTTSPLRSSPVPNAGVSHGASRSATRASVAATATATQDGRRATTSRTSLTTTAKAPSGPPSTSSRSSASFRTASPHTPGSGSRASVGVQPHADYVPSFMKGVRSEPRKETVSKIVPPKGSSNSTTRTSSSATKVTSLPPRTSQVVAAPPRQSLPRVSPSSVSTPHHEKTHGKLSTAEVAAAVANATAQADLTATSKATAITDARTTNSKALPPFPTRDSPLQTSSPGTHSEAPTSGGLVTAASTGSKFDELLPEKSSVTAPASTGGVGTLASSPYVSKPTSPTSTPRSKMSSPRDKPCSTRDKTSSPTGEPRSPIGKPSSKPSSPISKPSSPISKPSSPLCVSNSSLSESSSPISEPNSSTINKPSSPPSKPASPRTNPSPPASKTGSPEVKGASSLASKAASKTAISKAASKGGPPTEQPLEQRPSFSTSSESEMVARKRTGGSHVAEAILSEGESAPRSHADSGTVSEVVKARDQKEQEKEQEQEQEPSLSSSVGTSESPEGESDSLSTPAQSLQRSSDAATSESESQTSEQVSELSEEGEFVPPDERRLVDDQPAQSDLLSSTGEASNSTASDPDLANDSYTRKKDYIAELVEEREKQKEFTFRAFGGEPAFPVFSKKSVKGGGVKGPESPITGGKSKAEDLSSQGSTESGAAEEEDLREFRRPEGEPLFPHPQELSEEKPRTALVEQRDIEPMLSHRMSLLNAEEFLQVLFKSDALISLENLEVPAHTKTILKRALDPDSPPTSAAASLREDVTVGWEALVCSSATLLGTVIVGSACVIHPSAVLDGRAGPIILGKGCIVEERTKIINTRPEELKIGENCYIQCGACVRGPAILDNNVTLEVKAMVDRGCVIPKGCVIGVGVAVESDSSKLLLENTKIFGKEGSQAQLSETTQQRHVQLMKLMRDALKSTLPAYHASRRSTGEEPAPPQIRND